MLLSVILAEEPLRAAARFDRLPAVTCCDSAKDIQSCGFRDSQTILNEKAASFPPREAIIGCITDDFPLCETTLCLGSADFPPCEVIIRCITDDFPPCETALHEGSADFPLCETFVGWVMKVFPCRKVVRDGYEVHCLPAIRLETVTDAFLAVAIGLEMFMDEIATLTK